MNKIDLGNLKLKVFTEQDVIDYCFLNNLNINKITELDLSVNQLTDISVLKHLKKLELLSIENNKITDISALKDLKNIRELNISNNQIKDISVIQNFKELETLDIESLKLESDQIQYIKNLKNLNELWSRSGFKDISVLNKLNKNINIIK